MSRDVRPRILAGALFAEDLSYAEKAYLAIVTTIKAEFVDGERRHGSRAMGPTGRYSLHLDYLAGALGTSAEGVRKIQRSLSTKRYIDQVSPATFGRPTLWHALVVRGAKNGSLTVRRKGTPYGLAEWVVRGAESAPLTYRTPVGSDPSPTSGVSEAAPSEADSSNDEACRFHGWASCPADCADHPASRRRTA